MKVVVQRVCQASVKIQEQIVGQIGEGLLVLLGVEQEDTKVQVEEMVDKILHLRIMADEQDKMNRSVLDVKGEVLVISQFTLCADTSRGRRPSFVNAAPPGEAEKLYNFFIEELKKSGLKIETGEFAARMQVELVNDGPVTIILEV